MKRAFQYVTHYGSANQDFADASVRRYEQKGVLRAGVPSPSPFSLPPCPLPPSPFDACYAGYWTSDKDYTFVKEVRFLEPYLYKSGSKLAGQKLKEVADNLNCLQAFKDSPRDQRSVRERFQKIIDLFKAKVRKEEASSGISPKPLTETEQPAVEIVEIMDNRQNIEEVEDIKMVSDLLGV